MPEVTEVLRGIERVAREVFVDERIVLAPETTAADVAGWDSLTHVVFMLELERAFSLRFPADLVYGFETVGQLADWVTRAERPTAPPR